jgi:hypothetical protein
MTPILAALALSLTPSAQMAPVEQAIARTIHISLPNDAYDWAMDWSPFGVRLGREARWHLSEPGADDQDRLPDGVYRRVGWISQDGASGGIAACGDETRVHSLAIAMSDTWLGRSDLIAELSDLGVAATEVSRREAVMPEGASDYDRSLRRRAPARIVWTLRKAGHGDATLTADHGCTSPGMRSAARCWTHYTVQFRPADPDVIECALPGRYGA